ncbi:MAG: xanthine dehydrogenase small subunit [Rhizobiaceae bacterium]
MAKTISLVLNGELVSTACRPDTTVLEWLRGEMLLRGSKEGCAEGDCGACSVLVKRAGDETYSPANSCIMLMGQLEGGNLTTVEGLAASGPDGHQVQQLMAQNGSSQCGFCTPGIVCSLAGLLDRNQEPSEADIHDALAGNLCRCTGYRPIVEAAHAAAAATTAAAGGTVANAVDGMQAVTVDDLKPGSDVGSGECQFYLPQSLDELLQLRAEHPDAELLAGGTDMSLAVAHAKARWSKTISTRSVVEMRNISQADGAIHFGGSTTWEEALPHLQQYWPSFATLVRRFGSTQIRAMGTMAGNLANASPIGDGAPCLIALSASINLVSQSGERTIPLDEFFLDYRKSALADNEVIKCVSVPLPEPEQDFRVYKISKRYDQDISTVCGAFSLTTRDGVVEAARIAYGGMAATPMRATTAEAALAGIRLDESAALEAAKQAIADTFTPMTDMRGSAQYRAQVAVNLLDRLILDLAGETVEVMAL